MIGFILQHGLWAQMSLAFFVYNRMNWPFCSPKKFVSILYLLLALLLLGLAFSAELVLTGLLLFKLELLGDDGVL